VSETASPAEEHLRSAQEAAEEGQDQEALRRLSFGFEADRTYQPLYQLAAACLRRLGGAAEAALFESALASFGEPRAFFALGYHFVDVGHNRLAIPFLERALELAPGNVGIALELAVALTAHFQPARAHELLSGLDLDDEFWPTYQRHWCALLCGESAGTEEFIALARAQLEEVEPEDEEERVPLLQALDKLEECLGRLRAVQAPRQLIRDWHFIQYGSAILDYFDQRTAEDGLAVAGGRWVALWGSNAALAAILAKLRGLLEELGRVPELVLGLPDRDSQIVGRALAELLAIPFSTVSGDIARPHTLVVACDSRELRAYEELREVQPGQTVFALNLHWLAPCAICPDIVGVLSQVYYVPWGEQFRLDHASQQYQRTAPDERDAAVIAAEIVATPPEDDPGFEATLAFYRAHAAYLKGAQPGAIRLPFWVDSPLPGSYFH
jgi:tetratricopeptide (TPR) repeat protein